MKKIVFQTKLTEEQEKNLIGKFVDESYADTIIEDDCDGYNEEGKLLFRFRKNCIPTNVAKKAYPFLRKAGSVTSNNRGQAAGGFEGYKIGDKIDSLTIGKFL